MNNMPLWTLPLFYFCACLFGCVEAQSMLEVVDGEHLTLSCTFGTPISACTWTCTLFNSTPAFTGIQNGICSSSGFIDQLRGVVTCQGNTSFGVTIYNVNQTWHNQKWACLSGFILNTEFRVVVKVPVRSVTLSYKDGDTVTVNESTEAQFVCETTYGRPLPNINWYTGNDRTSAQTIQNNITNVPTTGNNDMHKSVSTLRFFPDRRYNNFIVYCKAANIPGKDVESVDVRLNVLYPPDGPPVIQGNDFIKVIENRTRYMSCLVSGGNPVPTLTWRCLRGNFTDSPSSSTGQVGINLRASRGQNFTCTCSSSYNGQADSVNIEILYPPTDIFLVIANSNISDVVKVIQNNTLELKCISTGNPYPSIIWKKSGSTLFTSELLTIPNIERSNKGEYLCEAKNTMTSTDGDILTTQTSALVAVDVLYAPEVNPLKDRNIIEGQELKVNCTYSPGNPQNSTFLWTRSSADKTWTSQILDIPSVSRNDSLVYTCTIKNIMQQTDGKAQNGESKQSFKLNVLYKASILKFTLNNATGNVTVKENDTVTIFCLVDSNPESDITLQHGSLVLDTNTGMMLKRFLVMVTCTDDGQYWCIGSNTHNDGTAAKLSNQLLVECSPRPAMQNQLKENITSALHKTVLLQFTTLGYPVPTNEEYKWFKEETSGSIPITNSADTQILTLGMQSNLTISNVTEKSLGTYKLEVKNRIGTWTQIYHVLAEDKPSPPTNFEHIQEKVTTSSITVQWITGFNGGLEQTFVLQYRNTGTHSWSSFEVIKDTANKEKHLMNYTVTNLNSGTQYDVLLYAYNTLGNSSFSEIISAWTASQPSTTNGALLGGVIGGVAGFLAILSVVLVLLIRRRRIKNGTDTSWLAANTKGKQETEEDSSDEDVVVENKMYESAERMKRDEPVYNKPTKKIKVDTKNADVYAVVDKNKKKEKQKVKKTKTQLPQGDIYENAPEKSIPCNNTYGNAAFEDNLYENRDGSNTTKTPKKNINQEGLIYADLAFNDQPKGQKKLVIHGLDEMTTYVQVDFNKKADPLPDSDTEEQSTNKKN